MNGIGICARRALLTMAILGAVPAEVLAQGQAAPPPVEKITDKSHPDYIRCRSEEIIGSRARFRRVCMTNREWADAGAKGGEAARDALNRASTVGGLTPQ